MKLTVKKVAYKENAITLTNKKTGESITVTSEYKFDTVIGFIKIVHWHDGSYSVQIYPSIQNYDLEHELIREGIPTLKEAKEIAENYHNELVKHCFQFIEIANQNL